MVSVHRLKICCFFVADAGIRNPAPSDKRFVVLAVQRDACAHVCRGEHLWCHRPYQHRHAPVSTPTQKSIYAQAFLLCASAGLVTSWCTTQFRLEYNLLPHGYQYPRAVREYHGCGRTLGIAVPHIADVDHVSGLFLFFYLEFLLCGNNNNKICDSVFVDSATYTLWGCLVTLNTWVRTQQGGSTSQPASRFA